MKKIALALGLMTQLHSMEIDGWIYLGGTGKQYTFKDQESFINDGLINQDDFSNTTIRSTGVVAGLGLIFPLPFFLNLEGDYTELHNSSIDQRSVVEGMTDFVKSNLKGNCYTIGVKGGYLFQPFRYIPWTLYPLFSYDADSLALRFGSLPFSLLPNAAVKKFEMNYNLTFRGPAIGFGSGYSFPFGLALNFEGAWQFRRFKNEGRNDLLIEVPLATTLKQKQHSETTAWLQGPRVDLSIDYSYCNWFIGVTGEWQYLRQFSKGEGFEKSKSRNTDPTTLNVLNLSFSTSPLEVQHVSWQAWIWKVYLGYLF